MKLNSSSPPPRSPEWERGYTSRTICSSPWGGGEGGLGFLGRGAIIIGTALPIMMAMVVCLVLYIRFAPIYPEYNRDTMLVMGDVGETYDGDFYSARPGYDMVHDYLEPLPSAEAVAATYPVTGSKGRDIFVRTLDGKVQVKNPMLMTTNEGFWRVFQYEFLHGRPYTDVQMKACEKVTVITDRLATQMWARTDVVGEKLHVDGDTCRVVGVVRASSPFVETSYGDIFLPLDLDDVYVSSFSEMLGQLKVYVLPKPGRGDALRKEIMEIETRYNAVKDRPTDIKVFEPKSYVRSFFDDPMKAVRYLLLIVAAVLIIPAINLSGMIASHVEKRMEEIGIRKAYGATNGQIMLQMMGENMKLSCIGGALGLVCAYGVLALDPEWLIMTIIYSDSIYSHTDLFANAGLEPYMLVNPTVLLVTFLLCLFINALSVYIPVRQALKSPHPGPLLRERGLYR